MSMLEVKRDVLFPNKVWDQTEAELFPPELLKLLAELHEEFEPMRRTLLDHRKLRQRAFDEGQLPSYNDQNDFAVSGDWRIAPLPPDLLCRRVEITGPVNSAKMVINMLSRNESGARADMAMLDFEDSMMPSFSNVISGYKNVIGAVSGDLMFQSEGTRDHGGKVYKIDPDDMAHVMVRPRGLHLKESNITYQGQPLCAGLLDLAVCFFHTAHLYLFHNLTPKFYIPKVEGRLEARWWNQLFTRLEEKLDFPLGTLRATFLIETLPAAFEAEEILYEIRDHAAGLNVGRWDKIFSDIKVLKFHSDRVLADRASLTMEKPWMENYAKRIIKICHERGALAIGGMSAFTPGSSTEQRIEQSQRVLADKKREADWGHDGCWVSHPYFIGIAMEAFQRKNQLDRLLPQQDRYPDLLPQGGGPYTLQGLRTNVRVGIAYLHSWQQGIGCVALDNLMEDLATLEISRAQTWQWLHHKVKLAEGMIVTPELVTKTFEQESMRLSPGGRVSADWQEAREEAQRLYLNHDLQDFFCHSSPAI